MNLTDQQRAAVVTTGRSLLVEAGAGTGKTTVLVQRFLHLLARESAGLDAIVAITFTEKAARTMRERLRREIDALAARSGPDDPWQAHRRALATLRVRTIHGFCTDLLRENAIEAGIDPQFGVVDEQEMALLQQEAIEETLAALAEEGAEPIRLLDQLRVRELRDEMGRLLKARSTVAPLFEALPDDAAALLAEWAAQRAEAQRAALAELRADPDVADAIALIEEASITDPTDKLAPHVGAAKGAVAALAGDDFDGLAPLLGVTLNVGGAKAWGGKETLVELKAALKLLRESAKALAEEGLIGGDEALDERAAAALVRWRDLWTRLVARYDEKKAERFALDFDDLERLTAALLAREPRPPRLAATIAGIRHLLVDEFQDTNALQQAIIYALAPVGGGRLFVVGDAKQSIYRFRQAQVSVFNETGRDIEQVTGEGALPLSESFRTHGALVGALNDLFARLLAPQRGRHAPFEARPGPLSATRALPDDHPARLTPVELTLLVPPEGETLSAEEARRHEARLLAERLHALEAGRFAVWDSGRGEYRPFEYGDAAILFAATTAMPIFEEQFRAAGLPYITHAGRGYYDRPEVRDLRALLEAVANPRDDLALATVLRSPLGLLSDETLMRLRGFTAEGDACPPDAPRPLSEALAAPPPTDQPARVCEARALFDRLWRLAGRVEVGELLQEALALTGYEALLALDDRARGERQRYNVQKFVEMARERGGSSVADFLALLRVLRQAEVREGEAVAAAPEGGAVQLMTIHAAKGLEFPVVAVVDLSRKGGGGGASPVLLGEPGFGLACIVHDEEGKREKGARVRLIEALQGRMEAAEEMRKLYVACTRAADLLLLSGKAAKDGGTWLGRIREAWGIETEGPEEETVPLEGVAIRVRRAPLGDSALPRPGTSPVEPGAPVELPALARPLPWLAPAAPTELPPLEYLDFG